MDINLTREQILLINLLIRIAVMAGITSLLLGFRFFADALLKATLSRREQLKMSLLMAIVFIAGVVVRKMTPQGVAMDLSLEGTLLAGFLGGAWVGTGVGAALGAVCYLFGETAALPLYASAGLVSGLLYRALGTRGEIWSYSLNPFLIIYNFFERLFKGSLDRAIIPLAVCLGFAAVRYALLGRLPARMLSGYLPQDSYLFAIDLAVLVYALGVALKMVANARTELIVRKEERQLVHARLATLRSQINPHFLFNTLNSITALIRTDADKAREMTKRLAAIFRKSLEESSDVHSLAEELRFLDDYLAIERVRFGDDRFRIVRDIEPAALGSQVPSLILQPIVENAIKHGISRRAEGGVLRVAARRSGKGTEIVIENEGEVGAEFDLDDMLTRGMGLRNVIERLDIYSCSQGRFSIDQRPGGGAIVRMFIPDAGRRGGPDEDQSLDCR